MWRRVVDKDSVLTLCNACGLYFKSKKIHRPISVVSKKKSLSTSEIIDKILDKQSNNSKLVFNNADLKIIHCSNCYNINTSIWRKDESGRNICNACGLFYKKKGYHRSVFSTNSVFLEVNNNLVKFNKIKRRKKSSTKIDNIDYSIKPLSNPKSITLPSIKSLLNSI